MQTGRIHFIFLADRSEFRMFNFFLILTPINCSIQGKSGGNPINPDPFALLESWI